MVDGEETEHASPRHASRGTSDSSSSTAIAPVYEEREIVLAQGLEYHNDRLSGGPPLSMNFKVPEYLQARLGADVHVDSSGVITYTSVRQRVHFTIRKVMQKDEFKQALETPGIHVVYGGHARYGRGPCFGPGRDPGDDWENSTDANRLTRGIFRWGYPVMPIETHEIVQHGYKCFPVLAGADKPPRGDCHPDILSVYGTLRRYAIHEFDQGAELAPFIAGVVPASGLGAPRPVSADDRFWGLRSKHEILLHGGWENTRAAPMDLGSTDMRCRVFCHFGCSSFHHNYRVLRFLKGWQRTATDRFAYWTTAPPPTVNLPSRWIYFLLKYDQRNDFQSWAPSLGWTLAATRGYIRGSGGGYNVI